MTGAGELRELPIDAVAANPDQPRKHFAKEPLEELAASIRSLGILEPIVVTQTSGSYDRWTIVAGERRWRAARMAGLTVIPALVRDELSDHDAFVLSMVENVLRKDMNPIEEADGYQSSWTTGCRLRSSPTGWARRRPPSRRR